MYRKQTTKQETCFIPGSLSDFIPDDHVLKRVDAVLDLRWLDEEVKGLYAEANGRPCIDPERAVRLMLAGFFHAVVHDRKLMREAQVNMAYRWFAGYELDETLPDHSRNRSVLRIGACRCRVLPTIPNTMWCAVRRVSKCSARAAARTAGFIGRARPIARPAHCGSDASHRLLVLEAC